MSQDKVEINLGILKEDDWIKLNSDNIGFYRVNYSTELFDNLLIHLESDITGFGSPLDRFELVSEYFALVILLLKYILFLYGIK